MTLPLADYPSSLESGIIYSLFVLAYLVLGAISSVAIVQEVIWQVLSQLVVSLSARRHAFAHLSA